MAKRRVGEAEVDRVCEVAKKAATLGSVDTLLGVIKGLSDDLPLSAAQKARWATGLAAMESVLNEIAKNGEGVALVRAALEGK